METVSFGQFLLQWINGSFTIPLWVLGLLDIIAFVVPSRFREPKGATMKKVFVIFKKWAPIIIFVVLVIDLILTPYNMYKNNQKEIIKSFTEQQSQIDDLQKQLSSITSLTFTQLPIIDEKFNMPNIEQIETTAKPAFYPAYSGTIRYYVENTDIYNHVRQFIKITVSSPEVDVKFTYIDPQTLPPDVYLVNKYSGTDEIIIMINDIAPSGNMTILLPIYAMEVKNNNPYIRDTIILIPKVLYRGTIP